MFLCVSVYVSMLNIAYIGMFMSVYLCVCRDLLINFFFNLDMNFERGEELN